MSTRGSDFNANVEISLFRNSRKCENIPERIEKSRCDKGLVMRLRRYKTQIK